MGHEDKYGVNQGCVDGVLRDSAVAVDGYAAPIGLSEDTMTTSKFLLSGAQKFILATSLIYIIWQFWCAPQAMVIWLCAAINSIYIVLIWVRLHLLMIGSNRRASMSSMECTLSDELLPSYSIIVPLYKEEKALQQITYHISQLNYPSNLLTVYMVLEEDDVATNETMKQIILPENFTVLCVPPSHPRTKPKACNYAMQFVRSELVVIYDAEDIPHPMQLRQAAQAFYEDNESLSCVQCQLCFYNANDNWLCSMFALEYKILFEYLLPALDVLGLPIPLGGTSNHLRVDKLRQVGGWDSYNVTEDAELGLRLARNNLRTRIIASRTYEEAPNNVFIWLRQRSRWIKGYVQTYIAHTRQPRRFIKELGLVPAALCSCVIGLASVAHIISVVSLIMFLVPWTRNMVPGVWITVSLVVMCVGMISMVYTSYIAKKAIYNLRSSRMSWWWSYPFYFVLHSFASVRAVYQLSSALHLWEKTPHNISTSSLE